MAQGEGIVFTRGQVDLFRQWFEAAQDLSSPGYLTSDDYGLARELYELLGLKVPGSVKVGCDGKR